MTRDEKVLPETRVCCQCCANVCSRSQALGVVCSRCPTKHRNSASPEKTTGPRFVPKAVSPAAPCGSLCPNWDRSFGY